MLPAHHACGKVLDLSVKKRFMVQSASLDELLPSSLHVDYSPSCMYLNINNWHHNTLVQKIYQEQIFFETREVEKGMEQGTMEQLGALQLKTLCSQSLPKATAEEGNTRLCQVKNAKQKAETPS